MNRFYTLEQKDGALSIQRNDEKMEEALGLCGSYVLKTDQSVDAVTLWELYMSLLKAESGFRMLKSALGLRPNHHQLEERVDGHILSAFSPCTFSTGFAKNLNPIGSTIRRILPTHSLVSTRLPIQDGRIVIIRKASNPDSEQSRTYTARGIDWKSAYTPIRSEVSM